MCHADDALNELVESHIKESNEEERIAKFEETEEERACRRTRQEMEKEGKIKPKADVGRVISHQASQ